MYPINVKIGREPAMVVKVTGKETLQDLRKNLYSKDERIVMAKLVVVRFDGSEALVMNESVRIVDIFYVEDACALHFQTPYQQAAINAIVPEYGGGIYGGAFVPTRGSGSPQAGGFRPNQQVKFSTPQRIDDVRLTDLSLKDLSELLMLNKAGYGRYINEDSRIEVAHRQLFQYDLRKWLDLGLLLDDTANSYCCRIDNLNQLEKELVKEGIRPYEFNLKVPFSQALSFEHRTKNVRTIIENGLKKYSFMKHFFPVGEIHLALLQQGKLVYEEILAYFSKEDSFTLQGIKQFYRLYGQFYMKKLTVGIKHVTEYSLNQQSTSDTLRQEQKISGKMGFTYKGFGFGFGAAPQNNSTDTKKTTTNKITDQVRVVGGSNIQLFDVGRLAESITKWQLWRIIEVKDYDSIHVLLPLNIRQRVDEVLTVATYQYRLWVGQAKFRQFNRLEPVAVLKGEWSQNSRVVSSFFPEIFQVVAVLNQHLVLVQKKRVDLLRVEPSTEMSRLNTHNIGNVRGCAVDKYAQVMYIFGSSHIKKFVLPSFQEGHSLTLPVQWSGIKRYNSTVHKGYVLGCGSQGLFSLGVETGECLRLAAGDFSRHELVEVRRRVYLFGRGVVCVDLDSHSSSVIDDRQWESGHPTTNGLELWKCTSGRLFQLRGSEAYQITFQNSSVNVDKFARESPVCFMNDSLYLPDEQCCQLIRYPLQQARVMQLAKQHWEAFEDNVRVTRMQAKQLSAIHPQYQNFGTASTTSRQLKSADKFSMVSHTKSEKILRPVSSVSTTTALWH